MRLYGVKAKCIKSRIYSKRRIKKNQRTDDIRFEIINRKNMINKKKTIEILEGMEFLICFHSHNVQRIFLFEVNREINGRN